MQALHDLPKSALKTELQNNAATYFRKLEALIKNRQGGSSGIINMTSTEQNEDGHPGLQQDTHDANTARLGSRKKSRTKSVRKVSDTAKTVDSLPKDESDDAVAVAIHHANKMDVASSEQSGNGASADARRGIAFNIYAVCAKSRAVDSLTKRPLKEKLRLAPLAYASLGSASSFSEFLHILQPNDHGNQEATADTLALLKQEILAGLGGSDVKVFIRCMADCLSGVIKQADKVLDCKNTDRLNELHGFILHFLLWANIQHEIHGQRQDKQAHSLNNYEDLVAAILSIYVDISILLSRASQDKAEADGRCTLSKIVILIGNSSVHQLNLLLQVTLPTAQDSRFMLPICKHMLTRKPSAMTNEVFVKYICAVRFSREILRHHQPQVVQDILNVAMTAEPSKEFLQWLFNHSPDAYNSLPESVKVRKVPLVKYLSEQAPRDYLDRLLDIVSDEENESQTLTCRDSHDGQGLPSSNSREKQADDRPETEGLFFTDISRDEDLARQVDSDLKSVEALHNSLDPLMEDIDFKEFSDDDDDDDEVVKSTSVKGKGKTSSAKNLSGGPLTPQDSDDQSDFEEMDMDTSAASQQNITETLSFEEARHNLKMEARRKTAIGSNDTKYTKGSAQTRPGKVSEARKRTAPSLSLRGKEDRDDALVLPESQGVGYETDSDKESFTTAKDNLDTTKESIIIDVDDEVTFKVRAYRQVRDKVEEVEDEDGEEMADEDERQVFDDGDDIKDDDEEDDNSGNSKNFKPEPLSKISPRKRATKSPKNLKEAFKDVAKEEEQAPDETSGSSQRMCLRSMGTSCNQSSLLRFFSPIRKSGEESSSDIQPTQRAKEGKDLESDCYEVVSDSCNSEKETNPKTDGGKAGTPRRAKNLKSLQIRTNTDQTLVGKSPSSAADVAQPSQKRASTSALKKRQKRLSRSARKARGVAKQASSSSDSDVDSAAPLSPVIKLPQLDAHSKKSAEQNCSMIQDAISEGIRCIRNECVTLPEDLEQPLLTKLKSSKCKSLTITGGSRSKTSAVNTTKQSSKQTESTTPSDKASPKSVEKRQGVSPLSPSKVKRVVTFGDTYRMLAGISADSQVDPGSLPASQSQSQKTSPKRARLQPKALGEMFCKETMGNQKRSAKKQRADVQPLPGSSQESSKSGHSISSSVKRPTKKPISPKAHDSRTPAKTGYLSSQEGAASQGKKTKTARAKGSTVLDSRNRLDDVNPQKAALKRRASLPPSKSTRTIAKVSRKSTAGKV